MDFLENAFRRAQKFIDGGGGTFLQGVDFTDIGTGALELKEKDYELVVATLCVGGGMGAATLIKAYR